MPVYAHAPAQGPARAAVLVLQEIFGVNAHIRDVARRIAGEGYLALAPDLFHRQGERFEASYSEVPSAVARSAKMDPDQALADIDELARAIDPGLRVGVLGFCMGGRLAFQAASLDRISASIPFYATRLAERVGQWAPRVRCPLLMLFGEEDKHIPWADIERIREALADPAREAELVVYAEADHGFFCDERASYQEKAARDAWKRATEFLDRHLLGARRAEPGAQ